MSDDLDFLFRTYGRGVALRGWLTSVWHGGLHGTKLAEALGQPRDGKPGDIDCVASTDRILGALEKAGWIVRGKMELTPTRAAMGKGHAGAAYPIDHFWMPQRKAEPFFDWLFPNMDAETRAACAKQYGWPARTTPETPPVEVKKASVKVAKKDEHTGLRWTVTRAEILPHLAACAEVTDAKPPIPALACVVVEATAAGISLRATNIPQAVARDIAVRADRPGCVAVNAKDLLAFASALAPGPIEFTETSSKLKIDQGSRHYALPLFAVTDIPPRVTVEPCGIEVGAVALSGLLSRVAPVMSTDPSRPSIFGAHVVVDGKTLRAEATNGNARASASLPHECADRLDVVIPSPAVKHVRDILEGVDSVRLAKVGNSLWIFSPGSAYSTAIMGDCFPGTEDWVPPKFGPVMRAERKTFAAATKSIGGCSGGNVRLRPSPGGVTLYGESDKVSGEEEIAAESTLRSVTVNAAYLSAGLAFYSSDKIDLWCATGERRDGGGGGPVILSDGSADLFLFGIIVRDSVDLAADPG